jgi:hypothetical protein
MKRSYVEMSTSLLPVLRQDDPRRFKAVLESKYKLRTVRVSDISKPSARPVDDIDEPENEDEANETKLNQNNARMIQLYLKDANNTEICALEKERIPELDDIQANYYIFIEGPAEVRCGNIMLEKKNVIGKAKLSDAEISQVATQTAAATPPKRPSIETTPICVNLDDVAEDWDDEDGSVDSNVGNNVDDDDDDCIIIE